jgi:hypothetical protein
MNEEIKLEEKKELKLEEVNKKLVELLNLSDIEDLLKSNEKIFEYEGITYRIKKPNFKQRQEAYTKRVEKFTELLRNEKYLLEEDLKTSYKKRGIDVDAITLELTNKSKRRDDLMLQLGEALKKMSPETDLQLYKKEIEFLNDEIQRTFLKKSSLLEFSIENQVLIFIYSYLTFLLAEKKIGEDWVRLWNNWEEFQNSNEPLVNKFTYYATMMSSMQEF